MGTEDLHDVAVAQGGLPPDNTVLVTTNLTTATSAPATGANLSLVVYPTVYYDAYANVTVRPALSGAPQGVCVCVMCV